MIKMKQLFLTALMLVVTLVAKAGDYDYLVVVDQNGNTTAFTSVGANFSVSGTQLTLTNGTKTETYDMGSLSKIYFSSDGSTTGIEAAEILNGSEAVTVYSTNGALLGSYSSVNDARQALPQGVYVVKGSTKTIRLVVR